MTLNVAFRITGESTDADRAIRQVRGELDQLRGTSRQVVTESNNLSNAFRSLRNVAVGFVAFDFFKDTAVDILNTNRAMEALRAQLTAIGGSAQAGAKSFEFIQEFAKNTPFEIDGLTKAFITLKNFGIEPTAQVMDAITNQSAKLGGSQQTLERITLALGQAFARQKLQGEEILQLVEAGVPVYQLLAEATGKNAQELQKMSEKGELGQDVIRKLIERMGELASGSNAQAMQTLNGQISNLSDAWHQFEDTLLNDKSEGIIKSIVAGATSALNALTQSIDSSVNGQIRQAETRIARLKSLNESVGFNISKFSLEAEEKKLKNLKINKGFLEEESQSAATPKAPDVKNIAQTITQTPRPKLPRSTGIRVARTKSIDLSAQAYKRERDEVAKLITEIQREIDLIGKSDQERSRAIELQNALVHAKGNEITVIKDLLSTKNAELDANERQEAQWKQLISDANEFDELKEKIKDFAISPEIRLDQFNAGLAEIQGKLKEGIISEDQAKELFDGIGKAFNEGFVSEAEKGIDGLSSFADQAAKNIQDSFADFLFDPFKNGVDGMLEGFLNFLRRAAAEAAATQLLDAFKPLASQGLKAAGSILSSFFHEGGVVGESGGRMAAVNQLVFAGALRFHSGGYPGLKADEVPAILQKGERVLSRNEVANSGSQSTAQRSIIVNNTFVVGNDTSRASQQQIAANAGRSIQLALTRVG